MAKTNEPSWRRSSRIGETGVLRLSPNFLACLWLIVTTNECWKLFLETERGGFEPPLSCPKTDFESVTWRLTVTPLTPSRILGVVDNWSAILEAALFT